MPDIAGLPTERNYRAGGLRPWAARLVVFRSDTVFVHGRDLSILEQDPDRGADLDGAPSSAGNADSRAAVQPTSKQVWEIGSALHLAAAQWGSAQIDLAAMRSACLSAV